MCGRYEIAVDKDIMEIKKILEDINDKYNDADVLVKTGEVSPTNYVPVLSLKSSKPTLSLMSWGFPKWDGKGVIINAKSETATEKKMFSKLLVEKRCIIPSTGFYEWGQIEGEKKKQKYHFTMEDSPMLYMVGIYNQFQVNDTSIEHFVTFTCEANDSIKDIHNRMPVILQNKKEIKLWLQDYNFVQYVFERDSISLKREMV